MSRPPARTRRQALQLCAGAALAGLGTPAHSQQNQDDGALDEALRLIHGREPQSRQGLSTHAPMVAEALCSLGRPSEAVAWVERERAPVSLLPAPRRPIDSAQWSRALGPRRDVARWEDALERYGDWRVFFDSLLAEGPWREVLDLWAARLGPGLSAAATHGLIRTAHAARALSRKETARRRAELARGLAYWAAAYEELPWKPRSGDAAASFAAALERLPLHWETHGRVPAGNIVSGLRAVSALPGFEAARELLAPAPYPAAALSALTRVFAGAYLRHGTRGPTVATIAFVHGVTAPCALRKLLPLVKPATGMGLLPYAWQATAAIYSAYARRDDPAVSPEPRITPGELQARAVENGAEHAVKFVEALLSEHAITPDSIYLAAAQDAVERIHS